MSERTSIKDLIDSLQVVGVNSYIGRGSIGGKAAVFGGQVIGQALIAACKTAQEADPDFHLHSLHCYFVSPTLYNVDILYGVQQIRESKSFSSYMVDVSQTGGTTCKCMVSFDKPEVRNNAFDYASRSMPIVAHPDRPDEPVESDRTQLVDINKFPRFRSLFPGTKIFMCFSVQEIADMSARRPTPAKFMAWVKADPGDFYTSKDHQNYHRCVIVCASDLFFGFSLNKLFPTVKTSKQTSLDHSMWFHADCDSSKWHLYVKECDHCREGRSLNTQWIYSEDGTLVATCQQDFLTRPKL